MHAGTLQWSAMHNQQSKLFQVAAGDGCHQLQSAATDSNKPLHPQLRLRVAAVAHV